MRRPASRLEEHRPRRAEAKGAVRAARDAVRLVRDIMAKDDSGGIRPCGVRDLGAASLSSLPRELKTRNNGPRRQWVFKVTRSYLEL